MLYLQQQMYQERKMKQEIKEKLKELAKIQIVEKGNQIIFVVAKERKDGRINKKKRRN